jgi:hypothetical protein
MSVVFNDRCSLEPTALDLLNRRHGRPCDLIFSKDAYCVLAAGDNGNAHFSTLDGVLVGCAVSVLDDYPEEGVILESVFADGARVFAKKLVDAYIVFGGMDRLGTIPDSKW